MFPSVSAGDEQIIRKYINDALMQRSAQVDELDDSNVRKDVRVTFREQTIKVTTKAGVKLPKQIFNASIKDLSTGGTCLGIDVEQKVIKNGLFSMVQLPRIILWEFIMLGGGLLKMYFKDTMQ